LRKAAAGDGNGARALLANELPLALREPVFGHKTFQYRGPLPKAVNTFISNLPERERSLARSLADELTDYIVDSVAATVERTLVLVELCIGRNIIALDELVEHLPWPSGLKLGEEWKRQRVADELRSMLELGVRMPEYVLDLLGTEGEPIFEFNEVAFAASPRRLKYSWGDFKRQQQVDDRYVCLLDSEDDSSVSAEGFDYGLVTMASVASRTAVAKDLDGTADLHVIGAGLGPEITAIMESIHTTKPRDGYRPIAWHTVFWDVVSEYEALLLVLEKRRPFCETDQDIIDEIAANYRDVLAISRPSINRRRNKLYTACDELVHTRVREHFVTA
jgi:hypothetical protein